MIVETPAIDGLIRFSMVRHPVPVVFVENIRVTSTVHGRVRRNGHRRMEQVRFFDDMTGAIIKELSRTTQITGTQRSTDKHRRNHYREKGLKLDNGCGVGTVVEVRR